MKIVTERTEIAKYLNSYRKYPVIEIDVTDTTDYGIEGPKVLVECKRSDGSSDFIKATADIWEEYGKHTLLITQGSVGITKSFSYLDIREMLSYANAPRLKPESKVVLVITNPQTKKYVVIVLDTGECHRNSLEVLDLEYYNFMTLLEEMKNGKD